MAMSVSERLAAKKRRNQADYDRRRLAARWPDLATPHGTPEGDAESVADDIRLGSPTPEAREA